MKEISILVTGIGGDIGENIIKCLEESVRTYLMFGCDMDRYPSGKKRVSEYFQSPPAGRGSEYTDFLKEIIQRKEIDYVFPSSEAEIDYFNNNRGLYDAGRAKIVINNKLILDNFLDKYKTSVFLNGHGFPFPRTFLINEYGDELTYPFVLKKRRGSGSKIVLIIRDRKDMEFYKEKYQNEDLIVQEYLGNVDQEYTVGVFSDGNNTYSMAFRRYLSSDVGITKYAELVIDKELAQLSEKIAECTDLRGSLNIQARKTDRGYVPFEINPRISGTAFVRHRFGFKDVQWWLDAFENRPISYSPAYKHGVGVRSISEVFYDMY
ncbi:ATP-grasp domain-containing protein [Candidatus Saganbacteria bacterium]|nr:ATP-grasp domain-containing protein [Candidatus Saganbacteria bacterium]